MPVNKKYFRDILPVNKKLDTGIIDLWQFTGWLDIVILMKTKSSAFDFDFD